MKIIKDKRGYVQYSFEKNNEEIKKYPEEISLEILKYLKKEAETKINKKINNIVITIPAHYDDNQKSKIKQICEQSGFKEIKMINEQTAAGIAYLYETQSDKLKTILIFDIGGGNFGISILKIKGNEYKVLASEGEEHLGGEDFNRKLFDYVKEEIKKDQRFKKINLNNNDILTKIKNEIRRLTIHLFKNEKARLLIVNLDNNNDFELEMNIKTYTTLCKDLWNKMDIKLKNVINSSKKQNKDINEILILNESKIPRIQEVLKPYFQKEIRNIKKEYVAKGATIIGNELVKENNNL